MATKNKEQNLKLKTIPLTENDFDWVNMTPKEMDIQKDKYLSHKQKIYNDIKNILPEERTFLNTIYAIERCDDIFDNFFSKMGLLGEVSPKKEIRDKATEVATELSNKMVDIEYDRDMYISVLEYCEGNFLDEKKKLRKEDIRLTEHTLREYRRMGFDLSEDKQKFLKKLLKKISTLSILFRKNINDYQDYILCTEKDLDGLSERYITSLPRHTDRRYIVTLQYPHIGPFMAEAKSSKLREALALKNLKRGGQKNLKIIEELVKIRHQVATILGYKHHADFRTENRIAKNGKTVEDFQNNLLKTLAPLAKKDLSLLHNHAKKIGISKLEHYDISYVATSLRKEMYNLDPEKVREYFPLDHVLSQLFVLFENLFSVSISKSNYKMWNKDVICYEVKDVSDKKDKEIIGYFALDLFPREGKYSHACMMDIVIPCEKSYKSEEYSAPFSVMVANLPHPNSKNPTLLSLSELETLFHEFGHLLHMTLTRAKIESQSGANVAWDFVETPSQIMENWVFDKETLKVFSSHYKTKEKLSEEFINNIILSKTFQNAYAYTRQLIQGKLDLDLHTGKVKDPKSAYIKMNKFYFNITLPEKETLFPASFGHLVGYDAGYYSYLWALVYASDAFLSFKTKGNKNILTNKEVGMKWRKEVLEKGSSEDEEKLMYNFLGRKPNNKAFLRNVIGQK